MFSVGYGIDTHLYREWTKTKPTSLEFRLVVYKLMEESIVSERMIFACLWKFCLLVFIAFDSHFGIQKD